MRRKIERGVTVSKNLKLLIPSISLFLLSSIWAISSPIGSSADDGFHLTSIWCAWGDHKTCQERDSGLVKLVPAKIASHPPCYVTWPWADKSSECINEVSEQLVEATYFNTWTYPPIFYFVMRFFVGDDSEKSVLYMRVFNALLASFMLFFAAKISPFFIQRALFLSWGVGIIPIGIFFIPSTNPSSWTIIGVSTFWAFFYSALYFQKTGNTRKAIISGFGSILAGFIAAGSRLDSGIYIALSFLGILVLFFKKNYIMSNLKTISILLIIAFPLIFYFIFLNIRRFGMFNNALLPDTVPDLQPNAIINLLIELPSFIMGVFGGQYPDRTQAFGELGVNFKYGVGWLEFNFTSITGIFISMSVFALFLTGLKVSNVNKIISLVFLFSSTVMIMLFIRGLDGFSNQTYFQPRYFLPLFLVIIGISLIEENSHTSILNYLQASLIVFMVFIGAVTSWLTVFTRYAISPLAPITNLDQSIKWWPVFESLNFGKTNYFILVSLFTLIWNLATIFTWSTASLLKSNSNVSTK